MKKKSFPITNIGSVSLMMIFIVLSLVTFATLSLSSATGDYQFSQKIATHNTSYYEACNEATNRLSEIDSLLETTYKGNTGNYPQAVSKALTDSGLCDVKADGILYTASYQVKVNDTQALDVELALNPTDKLKDGYYRVTRWQEISLEKRAESDNLKLIK